MYIENLDEPFKQLALNNQKKQGNNCNGRILLGVDKNGGGFNYTSTLEGSKFWSAVNSGHYDHTSVITVLASLGKAYVNPETPINLDDLMNEINNL
jgi:hypothetical protein